MQRDYPRRLACLSVVAWCLMGTAEAATDPIPEIQRAPYPAQEDGALTTLRIIPEACIRLEGRFTSEPGKPFSLSAEPSSARCQPRARLVDSASTHPATGRDWRLNDVIRVPSARCPGQQAVIRVWRENRATSVPAYDAQGRVRIYLHDALSSAGRAQAQALPRYVAQLAMLGRDCRR